MSMKRRHGHVWPITLDTMEYAVVEGSISTTPLVYCTALVVSQNRKNFVAHYFPGNPNGQSSHGLDDPEKIAKTISNSFSSPVTLRWVKGDSNNQDPSGQVFIEKVVRHLEKLQCVVTVEKVGEVHKGRVYVDKHGGISSPHILPCIQTDEEKPLLYKGATYRFLRCAPHCDVQYADGVLQLRPEDRSKPWDKLKGAIAVLPPSDQPSGLRQECKIYVPATTRTSLPSASPSAVST